MEPNANRPRDVALGAGHVGGDILVVGAEPEPVVDEFRVLLRDVLLEPDLLLGEGHPLERAMGCMEGDGGGGLVELAALDAHEPILDVVDAADAMLAAELVQALDERERRDRRTVEGNGKAVLVADLKVGGLGGGVLG